MLKRSGNAVVYAGTLAYRARDWSIGLFALDLATGRERWRVRSSCEDALTLKVAGDAELVEVAELGATERGAGGFGSTGR